MERIFVGLRNVNHLTKVLACFPHGVQLLGVQVPVVDVRADLDAWEAKVSLEATQLFHGQLRRLGGDCAQADKPARVATHYSSQVIVQYSVPITLVRIYSLICTSHLIHVG